MKLQEAHWFCQYEGCMIWWLVSYATRKEVRWAASPVGSGLCIPSLNSHFPRICSGTRCGFLWTETRKTPHRSGGTRWPWGQSLERQGKDKVPRPLSNLPRLMWMLQSKSKDNAPLVLWKMNSLIPRTTLVCGSLYLGQHHSPIYPCTLCYKTRKGPSFQKLSDKAGSQRQTVCIENKAKPIYLTLDN
jgi:hypothetical protein